MIIDGHMHFGKWDYKPYSSLFVTVQALDDILDKCGIDGAVLIPSDRKNNVLLLQQIRRHGKKRYWFFPWISPKVAGWKKFLEENIAHIDGIKVHSSLDSVAGGITNPLYRPILEFADENKLPFLVHCGRHQETASYKFALKAAREFRGINFILAHLGGDHEELKLRAPEAVKKHKLDNVVFDISATREFWAIENAARLIGAGKLIFASDYPVMHPKVALENIYILKLSNKDKELILSKNLLRLLKK